MIYLPTVNQGLGRHQKVAIVRVEWASKALKLKFLFNGYLKSLRLRVDDHPLRNNGSFRPQHTSNLKRNSPTSTEQKHSSEFKQQR